jgi:hypothetical protein
MSVSSSGAVTTTGNVAGTASYATNANLLDGLDSTVFATTGSNTFKGSQYISSSFAPTNFTDTASLYTDGGLRATKNSYFSSSVYVGGDLIIFGSQSVNYITSSQLNISDNIITVNTATPSVRFGGIGVIDSGSLGTGLTGSLLWDSQNNVWIYTNPSGGLYDGGMVLMGPPNYSATGNEVGITVNALAKGAGSHHMTSSGIFESGSNVGIGNSNPSYSLDVTGTGRFTGQLSINPASTGFIVLGATTSYGSVSSGGGGATLYLNGSARGGTGTVASNAVTLATDGNIFISDSTANTHKMFVSSSGNVGIGTTSPTFSKLQLTTDSQDAFAITTATNANQQLVLGYNLSGNYGRIQAVNQGTSYTNLVLQKDGGNVGIGTASPGYLLDVSGSSVRLNVDNGYLILNRSATNKYVGQSLRTANSYKWFVGMRETGTDDYIIYSESTATDILKISNSSGYVIKPYQPAFQAYSSGISVTGGGWYNISNAMTTEVYDIGSNYSGGKFTAPVAGRYMFYFGGWTSIASNGERYGVSFPVNNGGYFFLSGGNYSITDSPLNGFSIVHNLAAGDYVEVHAFSSVGGTWGGGSHGVWWGGYLLG